MHLFIPVFLPRKAQLVGANEARRHLCISDPNFCFCEFFAVLPGDQDSAKKGEAPGKEKILPVLPRRSNHFVLGRTLGTVSGTNPLIITPPVWDIFVVNGSPHSSLPLVGFPIW